MAVITDVELASYLRLDSPDAAVTLFAQMASDMIEGITGVLEPVPVRVKAIAFEVASRAYRNPQGFSSETIDDYTYRRDAETRQAGVYLTASESAELSILAGSDPGGAHVVSLWG